MKKEKLKNANKPIINTVGVAPLGDPYSEEHTHTSKVTLNLNSKFQTLTSNAKGITLIALVITIIVMLILVAVTISMAINGGLFDYAGRAVGEMQNAIDKEQELGSGKIQVGDTWYNSVDDYLENKPIINLPEEIKVGDYVNYEPTPGTYTISDEITGLAGYEGSDFTPTGSQTFETQTKEKGNALKWRVWSIDKEKGTVEIVAATQTTATIRLRGADGYNHAVDILNDMCKELYSNGTAAARSINVEDINSKTTYNTTSYSGYGTQPYTYDEDDVYPSIYDAELTGLLGSQGVRQKNGKADYTTYTGSKIKTGLKPTYTYYYYKPEDYLKKDLEENNAVTGLINTGTIYWLASRCVNTGSANANFNVRCVYSDGNVYGGSLLGSTGRVGNPSVAVRPVVSLPSSVAWSAAETQINSTQTWDIIL